MPGRSEKPRQSLKRMFGWPDCTSLIQTKRHACDPIEYASSLKMAHGLPADLPHDQHSQH